MSRKQKVVVVRDPSPAPVGRAPSTDKVQVSGQLCAQNEDTGAQGEKGTLLLFLSPPPVQGREIRAQYQSKKRLDPSPSLVHFELTFNNCRRENGLVSLH